ncbi:GroES-like protein [Gautieria morchelliformis]|nr:GroES-like protein [Gautieria morchelliformis]
MFCADNSQYSKDHAVLRRLPPSLYKHCPQARTTFNRPPSALSSMSQQRALLLLEKQGAFSVRNIDIPKPGPGDILVKVVSIALNPIDWAIQKYGILREEYPAILGSDGAGIVEQVGEGVTAFKKGDKVLHQGTLRNDKATFQEYTTVPAEIVAKIPENISFDQAASIPLAISTAAIGFYNPLGNRGAGLIPPWEPTGKDKYKGQGILIFGGASSVGQFAIQLARLSGFSPIVVTASLHNSDLVKSLGATHLIDRNTDDVVAEARNFFTTPPTVVFDAVSDQTTQRQGWKVLGRNGILILVIPSGPSFDADEDGKTAFGTYGSVHIHRDLGRRLYANLTDLLQSGEIKPNRVDVLPGGLTGIESGLKRMDERKVSGVKLIVRLEDTP